MYLLRLTIQWLLVFTCIYFGSCGWKLIDITLEYVALTLTNYYSYSGSLTERSCITWNPWERRGGGGGGGGYTLILKLACEYVALPSS